MIKIYSTKSCVYCKKAKEFFEQNNIKYTEVNVAEDDKAREEMIKKSGQMGVPVIDVNGEIMCGYNEKRLKKIFGIIG